jgi:hypothetical protein
MNPTKSIPVFEVKEKHLAKQIEDAERKTKEPVGTADTPNPVPGGDPSEKEEPKEEQKAAPAPQRKSKKKTSSARRTHRVEG